MSQILETQREAAIELERRYRNYQKDSSTRKTKEYLEEKLINVEDLWKDMEANHEKIEYDARQQYFIEKTFEKCKQLYEDMINNIEDRLDVLKGSSARSTKVHRSTATTIQSSGNGSTSQAQLTILQLLH